MYRALVLSLSIAALSVDSLCAQSTPLPAPGDRVRVSASGEFDREFSFVESRSDYLVLADTLTAGLHFIPVGDVTDLKVSLGRRSIGRAILLKGAVGAVLGTSAGALVALVNHRNTSSRSSGCTSVGFGGGSGLGSCWNRVEERRPTNIGASSLDWGIAGMMVGLMVGLVRPGEVWKDTWAEDGFRLDVSEEGRIALGVGLTL